MLLAAENGKPNSKHGARDGPRLYIGNNLYGNACPRKPANTVPRTLHRNNLGNYNGGPRRSAASTYATSVNCKRRRDVRGLSNIGTHLGNDTAPATVLGLYTVNTLENSNGCPLLSSASTSPNTALIRNMQSICRGLSFAANGWKPVDGRLEMRAAFNR